MYNQSSPPFNIPGPPKQWPEQPYATSGWGKDGNLNQSLTALPQLNLQDQLNALLRVISKRNAPPQQMPGPQAPRRQPMPAQQPTSGHEGQMTKGLANAQAGNEMMKMNEDQLTRNMRMSPVNTPGQSSIYGLQYDWDKRGMTPGQVKTVSPEGSQFQNLDRQYGYGGGGKSGQEETPYTGVGSNNLAGYKPDDNSAALQRSGWGGYDLANTPYSWQAGGGAMTPDPNQATQAALSQILGPLLGANGGQLY